MIVFSNSAVLKILNATFNCTVFFKNCYFLNLVGRWSVGNNESFHMQQLGAKDYFPGTLVPLLSWGHFVTLPLSTVCLLTVDS